MAPVGGYRLGVPSGEFLRGRHVKHHPSLRIAAGTIRGSHRPQRALVAASVGKSSYMPVEMPQPYCRAVCVEIPYRSSTLIAAAFSELAWPGRPQFPRVPGARHTKRVAWETIAGNCCENAFDWGEPLAWPGRPQLLAGTGRSPRLSRRPLVEAWDVGGLSILQVLVAHYGRTRRGLVAHGFPRVPGARRSAGCDIEETHDSDCTLCKTSGRSDDRGSNAP